MGERPIHVVVLVSGGLDGELAARVLERQGARVTRLHVETGFVRPDRRRALGLGEPGEAVPGRPDPRVTFLDGRRDYVREVVARPRFGRGRALAACLDCRAFLLRRGLETARVVGAAAVASGEVLGQHPWSQSRASLARIAEAAGDPGRVVRPLSALRLEPSSPERDGRLDRDGLLDLHGRGRERQRALAAACGIAEAPQGGGGCCLLADPAFAARVRDLLAHRDPDTLAAREIDRLRIGRHLRLSHAAKAIVARDAAESDRLARDAADGEWAIAAADAPGATVLVEGAPGSRALERAASIAARYSRARDRDAVRVAMRRGDERRVVTVKPASAAAIEAARVGPVSASAAGGAAGGPVL